MANTIKPEPQLSRSEAVAQDRATRSTAVDQYFDLLRRAMNVTGWTVDALAAHWECDKSYVSRVLSQEKPLSIDRLVALPDDLEAKFEELRAESFGYVVVKPLTGLDAQKAFVAGLIGVMSAPALPEKSSGQVKAELTERREKKTA